MTSVISGLRTLNSLKNRHASEISFGRLSAPEIPQNPMLTVPDAFGMSSLPRWPVVMQGTGLSLRLQLTLSRTRPT